MLHVFGMACNLVGPDGRVISIVSSRLGNGPFAMLVDFEGFDREIEPSSPAQVGDGEIRIGDLEVHFGEVELWNPRPDWERLSKSMKNALHDGYTQDIETLLKAEAPTDSLAAIRYQTAPTLDERLAERARQGMAALADEQSRNTGAEMLAGLGPGLTPAGDDFLVGFMHAAWVMNPERATEICTPLAETASLRTTTLSRAWLEVAAAGEAGEPWHNLLGALNNDDRIGALAAARAILPTGHTSGADALAGFLFGMERLG